MSRKVVSAILAISLFLISCSALLQPVGTDMITWTSREELLAMLDDPSLILLDARYGRDWKRSDRKIRNAERLDASEVESWEGRYAPDQKIVIYCS